MSDWEGEGETGTNDLVDWKEFWGEFGTEIQGEVDHNLLTWIICGAYGDSKKDEIVKETGKLKKYLSTLMITYSDRG